MEQLKIKLNGNTKIYSHEISTIGDLLAYEQIKQEGIAIALNQVLVTKDKVISVPLKMFDEVEIVTPFEGG